MIRDDRTIPKQYIGTVYCHKCAEDGEAMSVDVGVTPKGFQVWCLIHDCNLLLIDLRGSEPDVNGVLYNASEELEEARKQHLAPLDFSACDRMCAGDVS